MVYPILTVLVGLVSIPTSYNVTSMLAGRRQRFVLIVADLHEASEVEGNAFQLFTSTTMSFLGIRYWVAHPQHGFPHRLLSASRKIARQSLRRTESPARQVRIKSGIPPDGVDLIFGCHYLLPTGRNGADFLISTSIAPLSSARAVCQTPVQFWEMASW